MVENRIYGEIAVPTQQGTGLGLRPQKSHPSSILTDRCRLRTSEKREREKEKERGRGERRRERGRERKGRGRGFL